jgi:cytoskeletal protein CcmA (bactofilin family)
MAIIHRPPGGMRRGERGIALPLAMIMVILALTIGLAFVEISRMDAVRAVREVQEMQATTAAEFGLARAKAMAGSQKAPWFMMSYDNQALTFAPSLDPAYGGHEVCALFADEPVGGNMNATYSVVIEDLSGWAATSGYYRIHAYGTAGPAAKHVMLDSEALTYASFGWLTNNEAGVYFADGDVIDGLVHTNGQLNIWGDPTFLGRVHSSASSIHYAHGGPPSDDPDFQHGVVLNAPEIDISSLLNAGHFTAIRNAAKSGGIWLGPNQGPYHVEFKNNGTVTIKKPKSRGSGWTTVINSQSLDTINGAIYLEDTVWVSGVLDGQVTLATPAGVDIEIVDDLTYRYPTDHHLIFQEGFDPSDPLFDDKLALVSGGDVSITKSWNSGWGDFYLNASVAAPNGKFWNESYNRTSQKTLHLYGGITQDVRGPVGQVGGRGFVKDYKYDTRFRMTPPPHLPTIGYEFGNWNMDLNGTMER